MGIAFSSYLAGTQIQGLLVLNYPWYVYERWHGTLLMLAVLLFAVMFNTLLAQRLHTIEGVLLVLHVAGFFAVFITLWATSDRASSREVWTTFYDPGWDNQGLSCLIGIVASVAPLLGADASGEHLLTLSLCIALTFIQRIWPKSCKMRHTYSQGLLYGQRSSMVP